MQIDHNGTTTGNRPPESTFSGDVRIIGFFQRAAPSRLTGATVTFSPGARTPWKVNPAGQTVVVTSGVGWAQVEGEAIAEIRPGDVVWFPPGERHWEGATPDQAMTYFATQEGGVRFGEQVTDEQYQQEPYSAPGSRNDLSTRTHTRAGRDPAPGPQVQTNEQAPRR